MGDFVHPATKSNVFTTLGTMHEVWLRTNRRAIWFGTVAPALLVAVGAWLLVGFKSGSGHWSQWLGAVLIVVGGGLVAALVTQLRQPRIVYADGQVLFYLSAGPPIAVPVELVEAFFLGQGPLMLPGTQAFNDATVNLVARLSQRDASYAKREVKPALGWWCDGYVTIRGTWCERLDGELIRRLNRRLREVTEERAS